MNTMITVLNSITILAVVKALSVVLMLVYTVFAYLIVKMAKSMTKAVTMKDDYIIKVLAAAHFVFVVLVLLMTLVVM